MAKVAFRIIKRPSPPHIQNKIIRAEVQKALKPVMKQHIRQRDNVVKSFTNKPKFDSRFGAGPKQVQIEVLLTNANQAVVSSNGKRYGATIRDLVKWLFRTGTRPHIIRPRKAGGKLRFPWGGPGSYSRKVGLRGGKGTGLVRNAIDRVFDFVNHPGFKPTIAFKKINDRLKKSMAKAIDKGYERGLKKAFK